MDMNKTRRTRATLCLFLTAFIWGVAFSAQRAGMDYIGSFTFNAVRFLLGALSLLPVIFLFERDAGDAARRRRTLLAGLAGGAVLFPAASLQQLGVAFTGSAGKSGFITGLYIVIVPILSCALGKRPSVFVWPGAALAVAGLYLLSAQEGLGAVGRGDVVLLLGAVCWAVHILLIDRFAGNVNPVRFSMLQFLTCSALSLPCAFLFEEVRAASILAGYVPILYAGILSVGLAYTLQIIGQRGVEPARAAIIFSTEALFSALGAAVLLGETMRPRGYLGCAFIFAGILVSQITGIRRSRDVLRPPEAAGRPETAEKKMQFSGGKQG